MKAFVLCGGLGTRLRPYTYSLPKPMLQLGRKPILQYVVENLRRNGFDDLMLTVGYKKEFIQEHFGDGSDFGVKIAYAEENEPRNTAGSILSSRAWAGNGDFLVVMGDHLTDINLRKMFDAHKKSGAIATIALASEDKQIEYGIVETDGDRITGFTEKPKYNFQINTAIYAFKNEIFDCIREKEDFAKNVFPRLLGEKREIHAYRIKDFWVDIGRVSDYERLNEFLNINTLLKNLEMQKSQEHKR
jgi:NDP-sugar pyrophosphorylase family protein